MKISIVTPSFNQCNYLRRTIESVLSQEVELEYIIVDGGSTDGSVDILKEYSSRAKIIVEKDDGQADAISKGFALAHGEILAWLNSDDMYLPGTLAKVVSAFSDGLDFAYGHVQIIDCENRVLRHRVSLPISFNDLYYGMYVIPQEATFFSRRLYQQCGGINQSYQYAMDYDLWLRMAKITPPQLLDEFLACFRFHDQQKSGNIKLYVQEAIKARNSLYGVTSVPTFKALRARHSLLTKKLCANIAFSGIKKTFMDVIHKNTGRLPR